MLQGALRLLCGSATDDTFQPLYTSPTPSAGGCGQCVPKRGCHSHILAGPSEGGELLLHMLNCVGASQPVWPQRLLIHQ
jgi:hypothetical protein